MNLPIPAEMLAAKMFMSFLVARMDLLFPIYYGYFHNDKQVSYIDIFVSELPATLAPGTTPLRAGTCAMRHLIGIAQS